MSFGNPFHVETYVVESDVPVPPRLRSGPKPLTGAGRYKYPFASMRVGDSFAFASDDYPRVVTASRKYALRHGTQFYTSYVRGRIWRVS